MERHSVDIGGVEVEAVLAGRGPVAVVFENGLGAPLEEWDAVVSPIAERARILRYDRRRASPTGDLPSRSAAGLAGDLEKLLTALAVSPPYVLVGHSWGGVIARVFAHTHASEVVGLVFVDATHEAIDSPGFALLPAMYSLMGVASRWKAGRRWLLGQLCPAGSPPAYVARVEQSLGDPARFAVGVRTARAEGAGIRESLAGLRRDCPDLPPVPIHVLTAGPKGANAKAMRRLHDAWKATAARAADARYTNVPASGHYMSIDVPDSVTNAIVDVLDRVEAKRKS